MYCGALVVSNKLMYLTENVVVFVIFKAEIGYFQVVSLYGVVDHNVDFSLLSLQIPSC